MLRGDESKASRPKTGPPIDPPPLYCRTRCLFPRKCSTGPLRPNSSFLRRHSQVTVLYSKIIENTTFYYKYNIELLNIWKYYG